MPEHQVIDHRQTSENPGVQSHTIASPSRGGRYLFCLMAISVVFYLLPFSLVRMHGYNRWAGSQYSPALDYTFETAGQNADVVIFGDSSALAGIAPVEMSKDLGLKVINLPNTGPSLPLTGDLGLRYYLSVNRPPKLIVFYFTPWNLDYKNQSSRFIFEGEESLFRHGTAADIAAFVLKRPLDALEWPFQAYVAGPKAAAMSALRHEDRSAAIAKTMGHMESAPTSSAGFKAIPDIKGPCTLPAKYFGRDFSSVQSLISGYTRTTKVLVFLAPIPGCDNAAGIAGRSYAALSAAPPKVLPPTVYRDDSWYIHLDPVAVPEATASLDAAVKQALAEQVQQRLASVESRDKLSTKRGAGSGP